MLPGAVAVGASRQASRDAVTVVLVPQEYLTLGKGVLQTEANSYRLVFLKLRATLSSKAAVFNHACSWLLDYNVHLLTSWMVHHCMYIQITVSLSGRKHTST